MKTKEFIQMESVLALHIIDSSGMTACGVDLDDSYSHLLVLVFVKAEEID